MAGRIVFPLLAAALLAGCTKDTDGGDGALKRIELTAVFSPGLEAESETLNNPASKAPVDEQTALTVGFARADQSTPGGAFGAYGDMSNGVRTKGSGAQKFAFSAGQDPYYLPNGRQTKMVAWAPATHINSEGTVNWTLNGQQDVITAPVQTGSATSPMGTFAFEHRLAQIQFWLYTDKAVTQALWGNITNIIVLDRCSKCSFTPSTADATGAVTFDTASTSSFYAKFPSGYTPVPAPLTAAQFGEGMMIMPQETAVELKIAIITSIGGSRTVTIPARTYPRSTVTKIKLKFTFSEIQFEDTTTIKSWEDAYTATGDVTI